MLPGRRGFLFIETGTQECSRLFGPLAVKFPGDCQRSQSKRSIVRVTRALSATPATIALLFTPNPIGMVLADLSRDIAHGGSQSDGQFLKIR